MPLVPALRQGHPESPVGVTQPGSYNLAAEDGELLTEGEIFQSQLRAVPEEDAEEQQDDRRIDTGGPSWGSWPTGQDEVGSMPVADGIFSRDRSKKGETYG